MMDTESPSPTDAALAPPPVTVAAAASVAPVADAGRSVAARAAGAPAPPAAVARKAAATPPPPWVVPDDYVLLVSCDGWEYLVETPVACISSVLAATLQSASDGRFWRVGEPQLKAGWQVSGLPWWAGVLTVLLGWHRPVVPSVGPQSEAVD